ncbi:MAG: hypothetical protein ACFB0C_16895 [Leptolyngbyaceae cyanobacterium]
MVEPRSTPTSPTQAAIFQQFRVRYPAGSLTSELVMVQEQAFVVRVHLQLEDQVSVNALAADKVLEVAEDRARQRAFDLLGLAAQPLSSSPQATLPPAEPTKTSEPPKPKPPKAKAEIAPVHPLIAETEPEPPPEEADLAPPLELIPDPGASASPSVPSGAQPKVGSENPQSAPMQMAQTVTETVPMPAPIDLSDVIAQTDVELKRLAWSVKDGRDYLEQTYSKRSRHDLTDEELLAFLLHLESLPTPVTP